MVITTICTLLSLITVSGAFYVFKRHSIGTAKVDVNTLLSRITEEGERMERFANALQSKNKFQGVWGELVLDRLLESSGLRKGIEYISQGSGMCLKDENGRVQKPDTIILLPENKHAIIDSKVSFSSYEKYVNESDEFVKEKHLNEFLKNIYAHIDSLAKKKYEHLEKLITPKFVLMFLPLESSFSLILQNDIEVLEYALDQNIILCSPSTIIPILKTINSLWSIERQEKNSVLIANSAGKLHDDFSTLSSNLIFLGEQLTKALKTQEEIITKISIGRSSLFSQINKLKELGAKVSKKLPFATDLQTEAE